MKFFFWVCLILWIACPVSAQREEELVPQNRRVETGLERLSADDFRRLKGKRVGFVLNQTSRDRFGRHLTEMLPEEPDFKVMRLFTPEHGLLGIRDEKIEDGFHQELQLSIKSLYGETRKPKKEWLEDIDILVFDLQDVGVRYYTYISTLKGCLEVAALTGTEVLVLDRPNPLGGVVVDGHRATKFSFIACDSLPLVHGLTMGEVGHFLNRDLGAKYDVMPLRGWRREMTWVDTGLPLFSPSPNLAELESIELYPILGLLEWCEISVGRGTRAPFRVLGAPYIEDPGALSYLLNKEFQGELRFVPRFFVPTSSKFAGEVCGGVEVLPTGLLIHPSQSGYRLARVLEQLYPGDFDRGKMARHLGTPDALTLLETPVDSVGWTEERKRYFLYE